VIVRILGEGQLDLPESALEELNQLDAALEQACSAGEHEAFASALTAMLSRVRELGTALDDDYLGPSDLVLPSADASLAEVSALLGEEGLIPG
jgi:hypothetical protein